MSKVAIWGGGLIALVALSAIGYGTLSAAPQEVSVQRELTGSSSAEMHAQRVSSAGVSAHLILSANGIPKGIAGNAQKEYEFSKKCSDAESFAQFVESKRGDPSSPLNNQSALNSLSPQLKRDLADRLNNLEESQGVCDGWLAGNSSDQRKLLLYSLALANANAGDADAAACFVMGYWGVVNEDQFFVWQMQEASKLFENALDNGWGKVIVAANSAVGRGGDVGRGLTPASPRVRYITFDLMQWGASDLSAKGYYENQKGAVAKQATASEASVWRERSEGVYPRFSRQELDAQVNFTRMCGY